MLREWANERKCQRKRRTAASQLYITVTLVFCFTTTAFADCNVYTGGSASTATITLPAAINIARDGVGTVLYDSDWVTTTVNVRPNCSGSGQVTAGYVSTMVPVQGFAKVYETGVTGIGIKTTWLNSITSSPSMDAANTLTSPASSFGNFTNALYGNMGKFRVQLIKTGPILAGRFNLPTVLGTGVYGSTTMNILELSNNTASVTAPACTVRDTITPVTMPVASGRYLPSVDSTTGDTGFNISLDCPSPVAVSMTFTDVVDAANVSDRLSLSKDSIAKGVGYQIVYKGNAIKFGPESSAANNLNQFSVAPAGTVGALIIPFIARYIRTGPITPGTANANAIFTMSYQ